MSDSSGSNTTIVSVAMTSGLRDDLRAMSEVTHASVSAITRVALRHYLADNADSVAALLKYRNSKDTA